MKSRECTLISTDTFVETAVLTKLPAPKGYYELKFESRFLNAKDPDARFVRLGVFLDEKGLSNLRACLEELK